MMYQTTVMGQRCEHMRHYMDGPLRFQDGCLITHVPLV